MSTAPRQPPLRIWTVYDHPTDYPNQYVARLFENDVPTGSIVVDDSLQEIRKFLASMHLYRLNRHPSDDPKILEVWL